MTQLSATHKPIARPSGVTGSNVDGQRPAAATTAPGQPPRPAGPVEAPLVRYKALNATIAGFAPQIEAQWTECRRFNAMARMAQARAPVRSSAAHIFTIEISKLSKIKEEALVLLRERSLIERSVVISALTEINKTEAHEPAVWGIVADYFASDAEAEATQMVAFKAPAMVAGSNLPLPR